MINSYKLSNQFDWHTIQVNDVEDGTFIVSICSSDAYIIMKAGRQPELVELIQVNDDPQVKRSFIEADL